MVLPSYEAAAGPSSVSTTISAISQRRIIRTSTNQQMTMTQGSGHGHLPTFLHQQPKYVHWMAFPLLCDILFRNASTMLAAYCGSMWSHKPIQTTQIDNSHNKYKDRSSNIDIYNTHT
eukprot:scaffold1711_cov150-Ochromonas_danica.AAC.3